VGFRIRDVGDSRVAAFLSRVDRSSVANRDGEVSPTEAAHTARRIRRDAALRRDAKAAFGAVPASGAELLRFAERPPREQALERILAHGVIAGRAEMSARGRGQPVHLGRSANNQVVEITAGGRVCVGEHVARDLPSAANAMLEAARHADVLARTLVPRVVQRRLLHHLSDALEVGLSGRGGRSRQRLFCGAMTLLLALTRSMKRNGSDEMRRACTDRILQAISQQRDEEIAVFYLGALDSAGVHTDPAQQAAKDAIEAQLVPAAPPVEEWTQGWKKPLVARHVIHAEFWKEELRFYSKKNGWTLVDKNAKGDRRVYEHTKQDPQGRTRKMRVTVTRGELDFLEGMGDPKTHAVIYSGHSALGANGSQSIFEAPDLAPGADKLALLMCCRGKDNYAEFCNRFPGAMLITTDTFTYGDDEHTRLNAFWGTLQGGGTFREMRRGFERVKLWDEPVDNYVFPDEARRVFWTDADADGRVDKSALSDDPLFDVDTKRDGGDFARAISFVNSELFYHWEIEHEHGTRFTYGKAFGDRVIAAGTIEDPKPGELVRVTKKTPRGRKSPVYWEATFAPGKAPDDRDLYAAHVTAQVVLALAKERFGTTSGAEALRAVLMGAQALHYLCVYEDTAPALMTTYLEQMGLKGLLPKDVDDLFELYDAHANDEQLAAFADLVERKCSVSADAYAPPASA
jgi:hypothetical protein